MEVITSSTVLKSQPNSLTTPNLQPVLLMHLVSNLNGDEELSAADDFYIPKEAVKIIND